MKTILIKNGNIIEKDGIKKGSVLIKDKKIEQIFYTEDFNCNYDMVIDAKEQYISPGFIDIHTHGGGGHDFMDNTEEAIYKAVYAHMVHGTTSIVPTTLTNTKENLNTFMNIFNNIDLNKKGYPNILGLHLEGPYFSYGQRGAQDPRYLRNPEPEEYNKILSLTDRIIRWSLAPELEGALEFAQVLKEKKINCSIAHTEATCEEVRKAYKNGYTCLVHFYSGMNSVIRKNAYRVAGAVEAGYLLDDIYVEVIADGSHLPKELLELIYKIKRKDRICLVTDSMRAAGMPDGLYTLGGKDSGYEVVVEDNVAKLTDRSAFAGSVATSDILLKTMYNNTSASLDEVVNMLTINPATLLNIEDQKGSIEIGKDADIIIFDDKQEISLVMVMGDININKI